MKMMKVTCIAITVGLGLGLGLGGAALADGTPQDHHCKLTDGTFDGTKTKKQCGAAKGEWAKDVAYTGALQTGVNAVGGETTGTTLTLADGTVYELDAHGDAALAKAVTTLAGQRATVTGYLTTKAGVEGTQRHVVVVSTLTAAKK